MGLDEVAERSTILFPREMRTDEVEEFMCYLNAVIPSFGARYTETRRVGLNQSLNESERYVETIIGTMAVRDLGVLPVGFNMQIKGTEGTIGWETNILALRFDTNTADDLSEVPDYQLKLMDFFRPHIESYFSREQESQPQEEPEPSHDLLSGDHP